MTEQDKQTIITWWNNYVPIKSIIRMLPYRYTTAKKMIDDLRQNGTLKPRKENQKEFTRQKVLGVYNSGITSISEIANQLGLSKYTVRNFLVEAKLNRKRPQHNYNTRKKTEIDTLCIKTQNIIEELKSGKLVKEIAKTQNVSRQYVAMINDKYVKEQQNER